MSKRALLAILAILVLGAPAAILAGSNRAPLPKRFRVYDANGQPVGLVTGPLWDVAIMVHVEGYPAFPLTSTRDRLRGWNDLLFESSDCTGTPLMPFPGVGDILPASFVDEDTGQIFVADIDALPRDTSIRSRRLGDGRCLVVSWSYSTLVSALVVSIGPFTPPFQVFAEY